MSNIWGLHTDRPELDQVGNSFVSIGWDEVGDLRSVGSDRDALKQTLAARPAGREARSDTCLGRRASSLRL